MDSRKINPGNNYISLKNNYNITLEPIEQNPTDNIEAMIRYVVIDNAATLTQAELEEAEITNQDLMDGEIDVRPFLDIINVDYIPLRRLGELSPWAKLLFRLIPGTDIAENAWSQHQYTFGHNLHHLYNMIYDGLRDFAYMAGKEKAFLSRIAPLY